MKYFGGNWELSILKKEEAYGTPIELLVKISTTAEMDDGNGNNGEKSHTSIFLFAVLLGLWRYESVAVVKIVSG